MKITICGSIAFIDEMVEAKATLEQLGHEVKIPLTQVKNGEGEMISASEYYRIRREEASEDDQWVWDLKKLAMKTHFDKIVLSDAVLILNYDKRGVAGYIGANTLLEMGLALHLDKPIYLLNPIPEIDSKEEILGMMPIVIGGDLKKI